MPTDVVQAGIVILAVLGTSVTLAGCSEHSTSTTFYTPSGTRVQTPPAPANASAQPPGVQSYVGHHDGVYQGVSNVLLSGAGRCIGAQKINDFHVRGNVAEWGGYRGKIDSSGGVQMNRGFEYLEGQFEGDKFVGQLEIGKWSSRPSCVYMFTLERVKS
ncbi:MAG TPA: hypothetical protein VMB73_18925 [Acetobacteraceae bacterium]|jgi:hypothetical protein|nr:hypothetical protein [Acetobacteraceae bacterium]